MIINLNMTLYIYVCLFIWQFKLKWNWVSLSRCPSTMFKCCSREAVSILTKDEDKKLLQNYIKTKFIWQMITIKVPLRHISSPGSNIYNAPGQLFSAIKLNLYLQVIYIIRSRNYNTVFTNTQEINQKME